MKKSKVLLTFLVIIFTMIYFFVLPGLAAGVNSTAGKTLHRVPEVNSKVKIDGVLTEKVWQEALLLELKYEVEPGENISPPVRTEVLLAYGSGNLYVAFRAFDPNPAEIRSHITDRDHIAEDDHVGIVLDTFNDSRRSFNFYSNPHGVQADRLTSGLQSGGAQWDAIWNSAGRMNADGYTVEMAIPFSSLRFQRKKSDQVWRIDAVRSYPRNVLHLLGLFPRDRNNNCYMCQADQLIGFGGAKPGKNIELDPTLSSLITQERESFPDGRLVQKTGKVDPGLTARWSFSPNLTLSAAVNPDFSQVEADAAQLDINTQFTLYYPEKRPFFLEDANIFGSLFPIIYTRTLVDPNWGIKLTGKEGGNAIGFFSVQDNQTFLIFPWSQVSTTTSLNMTNLSTTVRYRRDVGKASTLGFLVTDREGEDYYNRVAGVDGFFKLTSKDQVMFQFLGSWSHYPGDVAGEYGQPLENIKGNAFGFSYSHDTQNYGGFLIYHNISPDFRSDLGCMYQVDYKLIYGGVRYTFRRNPGHWYTKLNTAASYLYEKDHDDHNLLNRAFALQFDYEGPLQSVLNLTLNIGKRGFMGQEFNENYLAFNVGIRPSGSFSMGINGMVGDRIDYTNAQAGKCVSINPILQYKMGRHLVVSVNHIFEKLNVKAAHLYTANLSNLRVIYQFNRRAFLRAILQYADYKYNPSLYSFPIDPRFKHLFSQILFSYKVNPQTVLFLGYSDDYYGYMDIPLNQNNRTFFLKIGYALVL
ncbi:MAG: hypothetical protein GTO45_12885 [Candidatus Aminicenantes bacterium]|nr:hypothetical protein [Candidatus Aminicenantes bacterium]NIM79680.1 hypothetical protein [Candidatus Aminicenantes bacterium]NIN19006.1 hypothetical protein [Candidatus Aminicenantes bacterium]NIN42908.1 hypothetical protein [Candidatus Aminicenantes bacterium]NIN85645.1 hypothetical protein [Candidatus Aminicenantes bacterium]